MGYSIKVDIDQIAVTSKLMKDYESKLKEVNHKISKKTDESINYWVGKDREAFKNVWEGRKQELEIARKSLLSYIEYLDYAKNEYTQMQSKILSRAKSLPK